MTVEGWRETTLGALAGGRRGFQTGPFGSQLKASEYSAAGTPVIMPKDLAEGAVRTATIARVPAAKAARLERYRVAPGDLVCARRGTLGRCALITAAEDGWLCGTGCLRVRLGRGVEPRFLVHYLGRPKTVAWLEDNAVGQTMLNLNTRILSRLPVRLPAPAAQRRIADLLDRAGEVIRCNRMVLEQAARVRDGILRDRLCRRLSGAQELPPGWRWQALGELCSLRNGHRFYASEWSDAGLPILRIQNLNGSREFKYFAGWAKPEWVVEAGELLFAWAGTRGVSFGPCVWPGPRGVLNQHIFRVRPRQGIVKGWLYEALRAVTRDIEAKAHGFKSSLLHVRKKDVTSQQLAVPPPAEQQAIAELARDLGAVEEAEREALERARTLRRGLVEDLLSGRVEARPPLWRE